MKIENIKNASSDHLKNILVIEQMNTEEFEDFSKNH